MGILVIAAILTISICYKKNQVFSDGYNSTISVTSDSNSDVRRPSLYGFSRYRASVGLDEEINASNFENTYCALMINNETNGVIVSHNANKRIYPASMTKLMTSILVADAIESGKISLDDEVTITHDITFREDGAMKSDLTKGCKITVRNLLSGLMICSYNDYCVILGELVAGDLPTFIEMMNSKAYEIGATNSHFMNPHGLDEHGHYVTAYDMYLIINEAERHEILREIDQYKTYTYSYIDSYGDKVEETITPTNEFLSEKSTLPSNIEIEAWKTGTTGGAGHCLSMICKINGVSYSFVCCDGDSTENLYNAYSQMFNMAK